MTDDEFRSRVHIDGFAAYDRMLDGSTCDALLHRLKLVAANLDKKALVPDEFFNAFVVAPQILDKAILILGSDLLFHHANGRALRERGAEKPWHHDFDGVVPWRPGTPAMLHVMIYPAGLTTSAGALMLLPGSHLYGVMRHEPRRCGTQALRGCVVVTGGPGLVVFMNSAVWHARATPLRLPRYDINVSYCQPGLRRPERDEWKAPLQAMRESVAPQFQELFREDVVCS